MPLEEGNWGAVISDGEPFSPITVHPIPRHPASLPGKTKPSPQEKLQVCTSLCNARVPHTPIGPGRASLVWLNQVTSIAQGRGTAVVNGVYSPLDRHMSHPLTSMGVINAQQRKAPMCLMYIRKEKRGQFSPGARACSSIMPCSRTETQLSFNPA